MNLLKRPLIFALVALLTFAIGTAVHTLVMRVGEMTTYTGTCPPPPHQRWIEENAVYAALLKARGSRSKGSPLLVQSKAVSTIHEQPDFSEGFFFEYMAPEGLSKETFNDYRQIDLERRVFNSELFTGHPLILVDEERTRMFFHSYEGRREFGKAYPHAEGILMLSRVGFNKAMDEALVCHWLNCGGLCGDGGYVLLRKTASGWKIVSSNIWIS